jgi:hypothetical protein
VIDSLARFVQGKLDATVGSRASSQEVAAAVTELKASGLSQESLDAPGASVRDAVASVRQELVRASIETALARRDRVAFFTLPASAGGLLGGLGRHSHDQGIDR